MLPSEQIAEKVLFGCFEVNLITGEAFRNGRKLRLSGQPAHVLMILLQRAGQLVTREELRALLWPGETFVDFDHGLNNCINRIRDALGDSAASPECIETLPKQGYRFIAPVRSAEQTLGNTEAGSTSTPVPVISVEESLPEIAEPLRDSSTHWRVWFAAMSLIAIAATGVIVAAIHTGNLNRDGGVGNIHAIAVLPLTNLSGDPSQEYLTDGITDELITELARCTAVSVISRTSIMRYKNRQTPLPVVARELGVDAVVESSLQRTGNHLRISAHLIAAKTDTHLWAEGYEGDLSEAPQMAVRIASDIGARLRPSAAVKPAPRPVASISAEAYEQYLKGQFLWNAWQSQAALPHFQRAVALEPKFAAAYGGIAKCYCRMEVEQVLPASVAFPAASTAVEKALALDPQNADAHAARSYLYAQRDWDWNRAEEDLRAAIAEDPGNSIGHRWYRYILRQKGRTEEALEQARLAVKADPASVNLISLYASELAHSRLYTEAIATFSDALEFDPNHAEARFGLADAYEQTGKFDLAAPELEKGYRLSGETEIADQFHKLYEISNYQDAANAARRTYLQRRLKQLEKKSAHREYVSPTAYVYAYAGLRDKENTLRWLESAYAADAHVMVELRAESFDFVRQEPRFRQIWDNVPFSH